MSVDMSKAAITARLMRASELAKLAVERRLEAKIDLSAQAVTARLRTVSELRDLCLALRARDDRSQ